MLSICKRIKENCDARKGGMDQFIKDITVLIITFIKSCIFYSCFVWNDAISNVIYCVLINILIYIIKRENNALCVICNYLESVAKYVHLHVHL